jgi:hypothetical protein
MMIKVRIERSQRLEMNQEVEGCRCRVVMSLKVPLRDVRCTGGFSCRSPLAKAVGTFENEGV